jgi:hypothetical protein
VKVYLRNSSIGQTVNNAAYPTMYGQEAYYSKKAFIVQDCQACSPVTHGAWLAGGFLSEDTVIAHNTGYSLRMTPRLNSFAGYITGNSLIVTSALPLRIGPTLVSDNGSFVAGTRIINGNGNNYTVTIPQTVGSAGAPANFLSYNTQDGDKLRLVSAPWNMGQKIAVKSGQTASVCVWIRPSVNTDAAPSWGVAATYSADAPRLIARANPYMGVNADTVLATDSAYVAGTWSQLCGTTPTAAADGTFELVVDADQLPSSNVGAWINVADWSCSSTCNSTNSGQFWWNGVPSSLVSPASGGAAGIWNWLLKRDFDPASNDNFPAFMKKSG